MSIWGTCDPDCCEQDPECDPQDVPPYGLCHPLCPLFEPCDPFCDPYGTGGCHETCPNRFCDPSCCKAPECDQGEEQYGECHPQCPDFVPCNADCDGYGPCHEDCSSRVCNSNCVDDGGNPYGPCHDDCPVSCRVTIGGDQACEDFFFDSLSNTAVWAALIYAATGCDGPCPVCPDGWTLVCAGGGQADPCSCTIYTTMTLETLVHELIHVGDFHKFGTNYAGSPDCMNPPPPNQCAPWMCSEVRAAHYGCCAQWPGDQGEYEYCYDQQMLIYSNDANCGHAMTPALQATCNPGGFGACGNPIVDFPCNPQTWTCP